MSTMLPQKTCSRCGHKWLPRRVNPQRCPRCQAPLSFQEGIITPTSPSVLSFGTEERQAQAIHEMGDLLYRDLSLLSPEEKVKARKLYLEQAGERFDHKERCDILKRKDKVLDNISWIQSKGRQYRQAGDSLSISGLPHTLGNLTSSRKAEVVRNRWLNLLSFCKTYDFDTLISNFKRQYRARAKILTSPSPSLETFMKDVEEDKKNIREVIPILEEGIALIDARLNVLKEAEEKAIPLVKQEHENTAKGHKLFNEIKPMLIPFNRVAGVETPENERKMATKLKPLIKKFRKLEEKNGEICLKINELKVDVRLYGFPTLILPDRLRKLMESL